MSPLISSEMNKYGLRDPDMPPPDDDGAREKRRKQAVEKLLAERDTIHKKILRMLSPHGSHARARIGDITQEAWRRILERNDLGELESPDQFLIAIARYSAMEMSRAGKRLVLQADCPAEVEMSAAEQEPDPEPSALEQLAAEELLKALDAAIEELPARERAVLVGTQLEGLPNKDVARNLQLSTAALDRSLAEARKRLKRALRLYLPRQPRGKDIP